MNKHLSRETLIRVATNNCYLAHYKHENPEIIDNMCAGLITIGNDICSGCKNCDLFYKNQSDQQDLEVSELGYNPYQE